MLNSGLGFSDEFEMEACNYSEKSSSKLKQQYKEWTYTMKKEGSAFFKTVKNKVFKNAFVAEDLSLISKVSQSFYLPEIRVFMHKTHVQID